MKANRIIPAVMIAGAMITLSVLGVASGKAKGPGDGQHLQGSWILTATITDQPLIHALITFSRDGSFVETAAAPGVSTGHGVWVRTGNRTFSLTNVYLRLDDAGQFIGTSKVRANFELNHDLNAGSGEFETQVFDADGNLLNTFGGTAQSTRIEPESL